MVSSAILYCWATIIAVCILKSKLSSFYSNKIVIGVRVNVYGKKKCHPIARSAFYFYVHKVKELYVSPPSTKFGRSEFFRIGIYNITLDMDQNVNHIT